MISTLKRRLKKRIARRLLNANRRALIDGPVFRAERLSGELWGCSVSETGRMMLGGVDLYSLASDHGTPLHVVDTGRLRDNYQGFLSAFSTDRARVRLGTSYKTNPVPYVLERLHDWGSMAEVISHFELWLALELGVPGDRIIFNGPGKSQKSLELAVDRGARLINADSIEELHELADICSARGARQDVGIRVTTGVGWQSQFGLSIAGGRALQAFSVAERSESLNPVGVHLHLGTGIGDVETYARGVAEVVGLARRLHSELGLSIRLLDLGGGFGVPTTRSKTEWDHRMESLGFPVRTAEPDEAPALHEYAERILPTVNAYFEDAGVEDGEIIFEPGRAITASAQMLLLSVLRVKAADRETREVILDGGRNLCMPLSWEFHEIHPVNRMREETLHAQNLYGPLCHPHDIIALNKPLPALRQGDVLAIMDAGAYFVPNETSFSNPRPGIVAVEDGEARVVRAHERFAEVVSRDQSMPASLDRSPA